MKETGRKAMGKIGVAIAIATTVFAMLSAGCAPQSIPDTQTTFTTTVTKTK